ncbi:MAG TPA: hypothetical protein VEA69_03790 [Tepidisphaeraceae bacterium]|nr:hypothetical protein [Tepidisphaeraceae bacterium]
MSAAAAAPVAARLPREGDEDWDRVFDAFAASDLPKDVPVRERTPYDDGPAEKRGAYRVGYRLGFVDAVLGSRVTRCFVIPPSGARDVGFTAGQFDGGVVRQAREQAARRRHFGYRTDPGSSAVTDASPVADRAAGARFAACAVRFVTALRAACPATVGVEVAAPPSTYADADEDYSGVEHAAGDRGATVQGDDHAGRDAARRGPTGGGRRGGVAGDVRAGVRRRRPRVGDRAGSPDVAGDAPAERGGGRRRTGWGPTSRSIRNWRGSLLARAVRDAQAVR